LFIEQCKYLLRYTNVAGIVLIHKKNKISDKQGIIHYSDNLEVEKELINTELFKFIETIPETPINKTYDFKNYKLLRKKLYFYKSIGFFGYFVFLFEKEASLEDLILINDFVSFTKKIINFYEQIDNLNYSLSKYIPYNLINILDILDLMGPSCMVTNVMFFDIRGFTSYSENKKPTEVFELLQNIFDIVINSVTKYNGTIDKFIGDSVMSVFGVYDDSPEKDICLKTVKCAIEIQKQVLPILKNYGVSSGIGINRGKVLSANLGNKKRAEFTILGDTVNTAQRFESIAKNGEIIIGKTIKDLIDDEIKTEPLGKVFLKGKSDPIEIYKVIY
jgi:class 3 adenylate cyclase